MSLINGFSVLPVTYSATATHYLYVRIHSGSKKAADSWPSGRTLFVVNVPPDATSRELILFFKPYGTVEKVSFDLDGAEPHDEAQDSESEEEAEQQSEQGAGDSDDDEHPRKRQKVEKDKAKPPAVIPLPTVPHRTLRTSGRTAHVVFLDSSSLDRCLAPPHQARQWPDPSEDPYGLDHYRAVYDSLRPPLDAIRAHADSYMELFEFEQAKEKQQSKYHKGEAIVDEDGFTLVTRGGAYGKTLGGGVSVATKSFQETGEASENSSKRKRKKGEKQNFYAFQKAEQQRNSRISLLVIYLLTVLRSAQFEAEMGGRQGKGGQIERVQAIQTLLNRLHCYPFQINNAGQCMKYVSSR